MTTEPYNICPADILIPSTTPLELYCTHCKTYHKLPTDYIAQIVLKSHGETLDKILLKLQTNGEKTLMVSQNIATILASLVDSQLTIATSMTDFLVAAQHDASGD